MKIFVLLLLLCVLQLCRSQIKIPYSLQPGHIVAATKDLDVFSDACPDDNSQSRPIGKILAGEKLLYKGGAVSYQGCFQYYVQLKGGFVAFSKGYRCLFLYECSNFVFKDEEKNVSGLLPMLRVPAPESKQTPVAPLNNNDGNEKLASFLISFGIFAIIVFAVAIVGIASFLYKNEVSRRRRFAQQQEARQDKQLEDYDESLFETDEEKDVPSTTIETTHLMVEDDEEKTEEPIDYKKQEKQQMKEVII